jgi:hypothetical protein
VPYVNGGGASWDQRSEHLQNLERSGGRLVCSGHLHCAVLWLQCSEQLILRGQDREGLVLRREVL